MNPCLPKESADALMESSESAITPLRKFKKAVSSYPKALESKHDLEVCFKQKWNLYVGKHSYRKVIVN